MNIIMTDEELDQIEAEALEYELENYPISGAQVVALVQRIRIAEEAARTATPFMISARSRERSARKNDAWMFPKFLIILLSFGIGFLVAGLAMTYTPILSIEHEYIKVSFSFLSFMIPTFGTLVPLMLWIERVADRRAAAGAYDAED